MDCKELKKHIIDYLLGELDTVLEMRINEHLLVCKKCQEEINNMEILFASMEDKKEFSPSNNVYQLIKKRINIEQRFNPFSFLKRPVKLYYAVATLFLGILLMSVTNIFLDKEKSQHEEIKSKYKTRYESPSSDSIVFYTAPSHRLGGT
ncbi:zf-HC2 domain-containing protein [candidate division WOR-3 bacterium]|nr:zf-HC2 domain-containing protein [candidate division WOR-3 bacterium]MCK4576699.1 zf-HC2 domain-containing protein [candidate division WOR-3 bacterium]